MQKLALTALTAAIIVPVVAQANNGTTTTVTTTIVKPAVTTVTTTAQTSQTVQVIRPGTLGKPVTTTTTTVGRPTTTTTTTVTGKPTVATTTITKPTTSGSRPTTTTISTTTTTTTVNKPAVTTTTITKPTVTTTINRPTTTIIRPTAGSNKPVSVQPAQPAGGAITGVASVDATNSYTNVNGVEYGPSLATVRGKHELNVANGDINKLVVGNTSINLLPVKPNAKGIVAHTQGNVTMNVGHSLKYAKHGNYMSANLNGESASVIFYQGYETPKDKMPTSGTATYRGVSVHSFVDAANSRNSNASVQGRSEFKADFGAKRITGTITPDQQLRYGKINLAGSISGNNIVGDSVNGYQSMEGRFFGPNAEEISGRYDVVEPGKRYINGTFGAKR